jgi:hypothetical protein
MKELTSGIITKQAIEELNNRGCNVWRNNNLAVKGRAFIGLRGVPDIVGFHKFTAVAVYCEVKTINDRMSEHQVNFMYKAKQSGCMCLIATDDNGKVKLTEWQND